MKKLPALLGMVLVVLHLACSSTDLFDDDIAPGRIVFGTIFEGRWDFFGENSLQQVVRDQTEWDEMWRGLYPFEGQ